MGYLHLAENGQITRRATITQPSNVRDFYVYVPAADGNAGKWVREDYFDELSDADYYRLMNFLEPFQPEGETHLSGLFSKGRERRQQRREERRESKAARKETKQAAKTERAKARGETFGKLIDTVGGIFGGTKVQGRAAFESGSAPDLSFEATTDTRPFYQKPAFIIGAVVVAGGLIYFLTRKKK